MRGMIESLSDFWLVYFKDLNQLQALYGGMDILTGQSYLDLLSLLLNNSTQDAPLFNKEFYKLVQIKETEIKFSARENAAKNCYVYASPDNIVGMQALQNKVLAVTALLEKDADFIVTPDHTFEFRRDPLNAYWRVTLGVQRSGFEVRNVLPAVPDYYIWLHDSGEHPPRLELQEDTRVLEIAYDGPAHTQQGIARILVNAINRHPRIQEVLRAALVLDDAGDVAPVGTPRPVPLKKQAAAPLDGYAVRHLQQAFAGKFSTSGIPDWLDYGVEKGDILRLLSGPTLGKPQEFIVSLVRKDALYINPGTTPLGLQTGGRIAFSILREPTGNHITAEPLQATAQMVQQGTDGIIDVEARTLNAFSAQFSPLHQDDIIELQGLENVGQIRILAVIDHTTVALGSALKMLSTAASWVLYSTIPSDKHFSDAELWPDTSITARYVCPSAGFTSNAAGTAIKLVRNHKLVVCPILRYVADNEVVIGDISVDATEPIYVSGWASYIAPVSALAFQQIKKGSVVVHARRLWDHGAVMEDRDYLVSEDSGQIKPLTVWRSDLNSTASYDYRLVLCSANQTLTEGIKGKFISSNPSKFSDPAGLFQYMHLNQGLAITGLGTFSIRAVHSPDVIELQEDPRLLAKDIELGEYLWSIQPRGTLQTENVETFVQEISFWGINAYVDRHYLYHAFGYLLDRFEHSSEAYRALIRGVFQLFMLGPTLERLESAVNTVAGFSVVRDDGEILLDYLSGADAAGTDGYLRGAAQFESASANFSDEVLSRYLYIQGGLNANKLYKIIMVNSNNLVTLDSAVTEDGPVRWELVQNPEQQVITSKRTYKFPKTIPLRASVTNPANIGVKIFRAFEVLTDVFKVTDYVETPLWWENIQIPAELWEGASAEQRQSSSQLIEHIIDPIDQAAVGDPGLLIGADHTGFSPDESILPLRHRLSYVLIDTWLKHHLFYVSFNPVLMGSISAGLLRDLENLVFVARPAYTYIVLSPASILQDLIPITDRIGYSTRRWLGGSRGEEILLSNRMPLLVDGTWNIGDWYRTEEISGTLSPPLDSAQYTLGPAQYNARIMLQRVFFEGADLPWLEPIFRGVGLAHEGKIENSQLVSTAHVFKDSHVFYSLKILEPSANVGVYTIGQVVAANTVGLGCDNLTDEDAVAWELGNIGTEHGLLTCVDDVQGQFFDLDQQHLFVPEDVGTLIRFTQSQEGNNQVLEIVEVDPATPFRCVVKICGQTADIQGAWQHLSEVVKIEEDGVRFNFDVAMPPTVDIHYRAYGIRVSTESALAGYSEQDGDVFYAIGMGHPWRVDSRPRTALDLAIGDDPIRIIRRTVA